jgi:hypothetical protein
VAISEVWIVPSRSFYHVRIPVDALNHLGGVKRSLDTQYVFGEKRGVWAIIKP